MFVSLYLLLMWFFSCLSSVLLQFFLLYVYSFRSQFSVVGGILFTRCVYCRSWSIACGHRSWCRSGRYVHWCSAYTAGAGAVFWAATYSGTCTAASSPPHCATGQRHLEREFLVAPHVAQSALSSPLCGARAAFDLHGQPPRLSSTATQGRCSSKNNTWRQNT